MTLRELWLVSPQCFIFIRRGESCVEEYKGGREESDAQIERVLATSYPMFKNVLEVTLAKGVDAV